MKTFHMEIGKDGVEGENIILVIEVVLPVEIRDISNECHRKQVKREPSRSGYQNKDTARGGNTTVSAFVPINQIYVTKKRSGFVGQARRTSERCKPHVYRFTWNPYVGMKFCIAVDNALAPTITLLMDSGADCSLIKLYTLQSSSIFRQKSYSTWNHLG